MYAIIEESGGQRKVTQGELILIDLVDGGRAQVGQSVAFDRVLLVDDGAGGARVGRPYVEGCRVLAEVVDPVVPGEKVVVQKFRPKKGYRRKTGHRQRYTRVRISQIAG